jgi:hypothetical protein
LTLTINSGQAFVNMKEKRERPIDPKLGRRLTQLEFMDVVRTMLRRRLETEGTLLPDDTAARVLRQALVMLDVEPNWQDFVQGAVIIGAVALDLLRKRR